jgi:iron complex outermembrane recepter protein
MIGSHFRRRQLVLKSALLLNVALLSLRAADAEAQQAKPPTPATNKSKAVKKKPVPARRLVAQAAPAPAPAPAAPPPAAAAPPPPAAPPPAEGAAPVEPAPLPPPADAGPPAPTTAETLPPAANIEPLNPPAAELPPPADEEPGFDPTDIETVKVTVDRRERNIQDYPGSVTAFTQEDLTRTGIRNVRDMAAASPSLEIGTQEGNTEMYIRGVGSNYNTELGDPAVANHIDGVYISRPRGVGSMLFDLERVEVNRGPQGTLRGRNATAGSLNIITAKPKLGEWGASTSYQMGNYSSRATQGMVNIPIGETLALRFAGFGESHDAYYKNAGPIRTLEPSESANSMAFRGSAKWQPNKIFSVLLKGDWTQEKGTGYGGTNIAPALNAGLLPQEIPDARNVFYRGAQGSQDMKHWGLHGEVNVDLGPVLIGYIGAYRDLNYRSTSPGNAGVNFPGRTVDNYNLDNWSTSYWHTASQSHIHELRIYAPDTARVRWTAGGFFLDEQQQVMLYNVSDKAGGYLGGEYNMPKVPTRSYAGFADATWDFVKWWRGTAGLRVTTEKRSRDGIGNQYSLNTAGYTGAPIGDVRYGTEGFQAADRGRTDYSATGDATANFLNGVGRFGARDNVGSLIDQGATINDGRAEQHGTYKDTFVDFRLGTDLDVTEDNLLYLMFSTGHQSGGFNDNTVLPGGANIAKQFKPESIYATELGSKNEFFDRKLVANVAAFWYEYRDQQFQVVQALGPPPTEGATPPSTAWRLNAAKSRVLGLEAELTGRLPAGFTANLAATLLDARFTGGTVNDARVSYNPAEQPSVNLEGKHLPRAPVATVNYGISQLITTNVGYFDWMLSAQTRSKHYFTQYNGDGYDTQGNVNPNLSDVQPAYTRLDANVGFTLPNGRARIDGFVNNLTNTAYMTTLINVPNLNLRFYNPPRLVGIRMTLTL